LGTSASETLPVNAGAPSTAANEEMHDEKQIFRDDGTLALLEQLPLLVNRHFESTFRSNSVSTTRSYRGEYDVTAVRCCSCEAPCPARLPRRTTSVPAITRRPRPPGVHKYGDKYFLAEAWTRPGATNGAACQIQDRARNRPRQPDVARIAVPVRTGGLPSPRFGSWDGPARA